MLSGCLVLSSTSGAPLALFSNFAPIVPGSVLQLLVLSFSSLLCRFWSYASCFFLSCSSGSVVFTVMSSGSLVLSFTSWAPLALFLNDFVLQARFCSCFVQQVLPSSCGFCPLVVLRVTCVSLGSTCSVFSLTAGEQKLQLMWCQSGGNPLTLWPICLGPLQSGRRPVGSVHLSPSDVSTRLDQLSFLLSVPFLNREPEIRTT